MGVNNSEVYLEIASGVNMEVWNNQTMKLVSCNGTVSPSDAVANIRKDLKICKLCVMFLP
jgi:hypothetical protein